VKEIAPKFTVDDTLLIADFGSTPSTKVAGFNPLVKTKSGKKIPASPSDFVFWSDEVPVKLKKLHEQGYAIVVFSN
jgi:hypothetical protein